MSADHPSDNGSSSRPSDAGRRTAGAHHTPSIRRAGDASISKVLADSLNRRGRVSRATHGFHTYPAALHPDAAQQLLDLNDGPVHDPFCGGGTVPLEAVLGGRRATGTDLSPIALLIARARTAGPTLATPMRSAARRLTAQAQLRIDVAVPEVCESWYQPHVAQELGRLRDGIQQVEDPLVQDMLWAVFSSILIKVSFRESDTANRRQTHHRPPGTTAILFHKKARELGRQLETLPAECETRLELGDARIDGPDPGVGLVITSPPYPGVYDYLPMQQLRLAWLDYSGERGLRDEIGSRRSFRARGRSRALRNWRRDTHRWITCQTKPLKSGARLAIMVGDGLVGDRGVDALSPTIEALRDAGATVIARASADRPDHARNRIRTEHLIVAERLETHVDHS